MYELPNCKLTNQYIYHGVSCWDFLELTLEDAYDTVLAPIIKPDERYLDGSNDYFFGPNDDLANLDYDVGALLEFVVNHSPPLAKPRVVHVRSYIDNTPLPAVKVVNYRPKYTRSFYQGQTSDSGYIVILGSRVDDTVLVAGPGYLDTGQKRNSPYSWYSGVAAFDGSAVNRKYNTVYTASADGDSLEMTLDPIQGEYPAIPFADFDGISLDFRLRTMQAFPAIPTLQQLPDTGGVLDHSLVQDNNAYEATVAADDTSSTGTFRVWAVDDSADTFFFDTDFQSVALSDPLEINELFGGEHNPTLSLDTTIANLERVTVMATRYPPLREGIAPDALQAGHVHHLDLYPQTDLGAESSLAIHYDDSDLALADSTAEALLSVFRWDRQIGQWLEQPSILDTALNLVTASLDQDGTYALFTVDTPTGIDDDQGESPLPRGFRLEQNYPNPFNATTTISFALTRRSNVTLQVYNALGQTTRTLARGIMSAGVHSIVWDGTNEHGDVVASGVYFYRLTTDNATATKKMLLLK
ncbi:T9SS type A sorting domain-containing protein [candidate division GN15 bacterium]|nr:T9SS type A sorting domain-containing protein [candidate division GN15 bacterium]